MPAVRLSYRREILLWGVRQAVLLSTRGYQVGCQSIRWIRILNESLADFSRYLRNSAHFGWIVLIIVVLLVVILIWARRRRQQQSMPDALRPSDLIFSFEQKI